jgi:uncharacterized metal-binding protein
MQKLKCGSSTQWAMTEKNQGLAHCNRIRQLTLVNQLGELLNRIVAQTTGLNMVTINTSHQETLTIDGSKFR